MTLTFELEAWFLYVTLAHWGEHLYQACWKSINTGQSQTPDKHLYNMGKYYNLWPWTMTLTFWVGGVVLVNDTSCYGVHMHQVIQVPMTSNRVWLKIINTGQSYTPDKHLYNMGQYCNLWPWTMTLIIELEVWFLCATLRIIEVNTCTKFGESPSILDKGIL